MANCLLLRRLHKFAAVLSFLHTNCTVNGCSVLRNSTLWARERKNRRNERPCSKTIRCRRTGERSGRAANGARISFPPANLRPGDLDLVLGGYGAGGDS